VDGVLSKETVQILRQAVKGWFEHVWLPGGTDHPTVTLSQLIRSHEALRAKFERAERERDAAEARASDCALDAGRWRAEADAARTQLAALRF
jgi:hypothetical protein